MAPQRQNQSSSRRSSVAPGISRNRVSNQAPRHHNSSPNMTPIRRFKRHRDAGSLSAEGLFHGLNSKEASDSMELIQHEFERFMANREKGKGKAREDGTDIEEEDDSAIDDAADSRGLGMEEETGDEEEQGVQKGKYTQEERYQHLLAFWEKRKWSQFFSLYKRYDAKAKFPLSQWNRYVNRFWATLTKDHMADQQDVLERIRTHSTIAAKVDETKYLPAARFELEEKVLRDYQKVLRSLNTEDISRISQRFTLATLYTSHYEYVKHLRSLNVTGQTASKTVNQILSNYFTERQGKPMSIQNIKNQVQAGRHWYELMTSSDTAHFGLGLVVLLPTRKFSNMAFIADDIWTFLLKQIPQVPQIVLDLGVAMNSIGQAVQVEGIGNVTAPLLGYELRKAVDLPELNRDSFNACLATYPTLDIKAAYRTIKVAKRTTNPDRVQDLVQKEWERKNQRDAHEFLARADQVERSAQRESLILRRQGRDRLSKVATEIEHSEDSSSDETFVPLNSEIELVVESSDESSSDDSAASQPSEPANPGGYESISEDSSDSSDSGSEVLPSITQISTKV